MIIVCLKVGYEPDHVSHSKCILNMKHDGQLYEI